MDGSGLGVHEARSPDLGEGRKHTQVRAGTRQVETLRARPSRAPPCACAATERQVQAAHRWGRFTCLVCGRRRGCFWEPALGAAAASSRGGRMESGAQVPLPSSPSLGRPARDPTHPPLTHQ